jgi:hypothetical protein
LIINKHLPKEIGRMQVMIDLRGIKFKNQLGPSIRLFQNYGFCAVWRKSCAPPAEFVFYSSGLNCTHRDAETGDPARLPAQGLIK